MSDEKISGGSAETVDAQNEDLAKTEELTDSIKQQAAYADAVIDEIAEETEKELDNIKDDIKDTVNEIEEELDTQFNGENTGSVHKRAIVIIVLAVLAAALIVLAVIFLPKLFLKNKYEQYIDVSGRTIGQVAKEQGFDNYKEFLEKWKLPADMPENTSESSAYNQIPFGVIIDMNEFEDMHTVEEAKALLNLPDWVTKDTPWGEAVGEATLDAYVGAKNLDRFKSAYGFGDEVTGDTLYKDIRDKVDSIDKQKREETENHSQSAKETPRETDAPTEAPAEDAPTDAPAETQDTASTAPAA